MRTRPARRPLAAAAAILLAAAAPALAAPPPAPPVRMQTYAFPDGTGTIDVPEGWTCTAQSAADPVVVTGPAGQSVGLGLVVSVQTPDSPLEQMYRQNVDQARQMGLPLPPPLQGVVVAPFGDPVQAKPAIMAQLSAMHAADAGWTMRFGTAIRSQPVAPALPGGRAQLATYTYTVTAGDGTRAQHHVEARLEADPAGPGGWMFCESNVEAPAATFDRDAAVLSAVYRSMKVDQQALSDVWAGRNGGGYSGGACVGPAARYGSASDARSRAVHRSSVNMAEMLSGRQKIVNTRTGEERTVDYYDAPAIVRSLNEQATTPDEWVVVHRADEE